MNRRRALAVLAIGLMATVPARADFEADIIDWLRGEGFEQIDVTRTFLGRVRILASKASGTREVIFNPRTKEVLRNAWTSSDGSSGSDFGDDRDDSGDDDGGDDHSGGSDDHGGNSGSGGGDDSGSSGHGSRHDDSSGED